MYGEKNKEDWSFLDTENSIYKLAWGAFYEPERHWKMELTWQSLAQIGIEELRRNNEAFKTCRQKQLRAAIDALVAYSKGQIAEAALGVAMENIKDIVNRTDDKKIEVQFGASADYLHKFLVYCIVNGSPSNYGVKALSWAVPKFYNNANRNAKTHEEALVRIRAAIKSKLTKLDKTNIRWQ